jgi:hypothetical protein
MLDEAEVERASVLVRDSMELGIARLPPAFSGCALLP